MALFKRPDLEAQGLTKDQIDFVMTEANRSLSKNYVLSSDVQAQIDEAVKTAQAAPVNVLESDEYKKLEADFAAYKDEQQTISGEAFAGVKPKFRGTVYGMLNRGDGAEPVEKQLEGIKKDYEEYFFEANQQNSGAPRNTPQYSQAPGHAGVNPTSEEDKLYKQLSENWK